ncbi:Low temperature viability protein-domain-containing protein [Cunninghamella echinulata]|nr:Low temperature viability protein-domain-containing protein [Cunninghamella echinulata]
MPKKGFIDRKQAKHYHVVHRSQRDPLINDTDASSRVLQEVVPGNLIKHKTPEELERIRAKPKKMTQDEIDQRVGQAALHGIFFDDAEYDYMQHLKPMGAPDAVFLEAPTARKEKTKQQEKQQQSTGLFDDVNSKKNPNLFELPTDVLPSSVEVNTKLMGQTGLEGGLQPDMDPRLREVLEALEDEEYVEDDLDESFFDNLNDDAAEPYNPDEDEYYDDEEEEYEYEDIEEDGPVDPENYDWQTAFNKFKRNQKRGGSDDEFDDDDFDIRSKGTGFSVSSSAMHRNAQLRTLDDRFDRIEEEYMNDDDEEDHEFDGDISKERADFESILDDFLANYEVVGNKIAPKLEGEDSIQKLDTIRKALDRINIKEEDEEEAAKREKKQRSAKEKLDDPWARPEQRKKATWDCQSVLSTYSNLENHPQLISDRGPKKKISIDPKTGMPILVEDDSKKQRNKYAKYKSRKHGDDNDGEDNNEDANDDDSEEEEEEEEDRPNLGERRSKAETKEEKKLRKQAIKDAKKVTHTHIYIYINTIALLINIIFII